MILERPRYVAANCVLLRDVGDNLGDRCPNRVRSKIFALGRASPIG